MSEERYWDVIATEQLLSRSGYFSGDLTFRFLATFLAI